VTQSRRKTSADSLVNLWKQLQADPIAQQSNILIAPVNSVGAFSVVQVCENLGFRNIQQRTNHRQRTHRILGSYTKTMHRRHTAQSFRARAAQKPHHHSLCLIVLSMRRRNFIKLALPYYLGKKSITLFARQRFKIALARIEFHLW
jgi:hypothetical protein